MKTSARIIAILLLIVFLIEGSAPVVSAPVPASIPANKLGVAVGAYLRPATGWGSVATNYRITVGDNGLSILNIYLDWVDGDLTSPSHVFINYMVDLISKATAPNTPVIMITWQPTANQYMSGCSKNYAASQAIPYPDIISGVCDLYISKFAADLSARNERFLIRFANEMNVNASPWWPGHFGLGPEAYIAAYQHVYDVFTQAQRSAGKVNAEWVWAPNYFSWPAETWNLLHNYYPGDRYVDWIGLSGYNWYPYANNEPYRWFNEIFGEVDGSNVYYSSFSPGVLYDLACHYAKPQIIAEYGTVTDPGNLSMKRDWITDALARIPNYPFLRAAVWFNDRLDGTSVDFRITDTPLTPPGSVPALFTNTYRTAISAPTFQNKLPSLKEATPPTTFCGNAAQIVPTFRLSPSALILLRGQTADISLIGMFYSSHPTVNLIPPGGVNITGQIIADGLTPPWGKDQIRISVGSSVPNGRYVLTIQVNGASYPLSVVVVDKINTISLPAVRK
jgi:hypothetical protein